MIFEVEQRADGAFVVPRDAIVDGAAGLRRVVRDANGTAELVNVTIVAEGGEDVLVRAEDGTLTAGESIVVRGNERLRQGQPLQVLSERASDDTTPSPSDG